MHIVLHCSAPLQALLATLLMWLLTSAGAMFVFCLRSTHPLMMSGMLSLSAGIMLASSFFSLLAPCLDFAAAQGQPPWLPACGGFLLGACALMLCDMAFSALMKARRPQAHLRQQDASRLLVTSMILHNIPEGLVVGVAFAAAQSPGALKAAWLLALGIGAQNIPEGAAISLPLRRDGFSRPRACLLGSLSGLSEPVFGLLGALLSSAASACLPLLLSFAAGAMVLAVTEELIPESRQNDHSHLMTLLLLIGFTLMMALDVALT